MTTTTPTKPAGLVLSDLDLEVTEPWDITASTTTVSLHVHTGHGTVWSIHLPADILERAEDALAEAQHRAEVERRGLRP